MNIQHSSRSDEWYTPIAILTRAQCVLGSIDFDPASDAFGNARVGARYFFTKEQDGLKTPWLSGTAWINPPGGKVKNRSNTELFWQRLMAHRDAGELTHAIFMAFSLEAAQTTQRDGKGGLLRFPHCAPAKRIAFDSKNKPGAIAPSHGNIIVYVPGSVDRTELFRDTFSDLGFVGRGSL